jgi:TolB-like protein/predicted Ser/Thr protein kinase
MTRTSELEAVQQIGRYVDCALLGHGGMGAVYRARDPELDRPVAIKVMLQATEDFIARFRREAQAIARLVHPNIVQVYDFGVDEEGNPYFVMELIDGTPLDQVVRERGRLLPLEVIRLVRQAAEGLGCAHRAGIVHRDVKPSNLIVDGRGTVKLVDFGIARVSDTAVQLTAASALMGTPGYMAPEQAQGKPVDHRADLYALGLTMYELLAGTPPFQAADAISLVVKNLQEPLPDLRITGIGLPEELVHLVEMMAVKDPDARIQSCDAVIAVLDSIESQIRDGAADPGSVPTHKVPPTRVHAKLEEHAQENAATSARTNTNAGVHASVVGTAGPLAARQTGAKKSTPLVLAAVGAVVIAGGVAAFALRAPKPDPKPPVVVKPPETPAAKIEPPPQQKIELQAAPVGPMRVAVLKFKNVGNDAKLMPLELGIPETAGTKLVGTPGVTVMERSDLDSDIGEIDKRGDVHFDAATVARLGQLKGIEVAVQGGFQRAGKEVRITARFVKVENAEVLATVVVTHSVHDVFGAQDAVADGLLPKLKALAAAREKK